MFAPKRRRDSWAHPSKRIDSSEMLLVWRQPYSSRSPTWHPQRRSLSQSSLGLRTPAGACRCYYAATVYFGPGKMADPKKGFALLNNSDPWSAMAQAVWGPGLIIVILAVLNSAIANANAGANAATRVGYSLARIGLLPRMLQKIHPRFRTPYVAVNVQALGGIILAVALGFAAGGPLPAFALLGTIATIIVICIYILTNISNIVFYAREKRSEFNIFLNLIVPVVGSLIFLPALVASFGIDFLGLGIPPLTAPANLAPYIILVWMLIGIGALVYFLRRDPTRLAQTGRIFLDEAATGSRS